MDSFNELKNVEILNTDFKNIKKVELSACLFIIELHKYFYLQVKVILRI